MPCGSEPLEAVVVCESGVEVPGVAVAEGDFCGWSTMVDCEDEREKVLEKGAPRWVSLSSGTRQSHCSLHAPGRRLLLVNFHDMVSDVGLHDVVARIGQDQVE